MSKETAFIYHMNIDYDGAKQSSYTGVSVSWGTAARNVEKFSTGDLEEDWKNAVVWLSERKDCLQIMGGSSVDHFTMDGDGYKWVQDEKYGEIPVRKNKKCIEKKKGTAFVRKITKDKVYIAVSGDYFCWSFVLPRNDAKDGELKKDESYEFHAAMIDKKCVEYLFVHPKPKPLRKYGLPLPKEPDDYKDPIQMGRYMKELKEFFGVE